MLESVCIDFPLLVAVTSTLKTSQISEVLVVFTTYPTENIYVVYQGKRY